MTNPGKTAGLRKKRRQRFWATALLLAALMGGGSILFNGTPVRPAWPPEREGESVPVRPAPGDPPFHRTPLAGTFAERRRLYLDWGAQQLIPDGRNAIWAELLRMAAGKGTFDDILLDGLLEFVDARNDTADFVVAGLIRLYYTHLQENPELPQARKIRRTLLDFQYWLDEPNPDLGAMELWTENHQILIYTSEYLAGQLFPDETFTNNGMSGRERMAGARAKICRWIDWRVRTGFAEWDSIPYYPEDLAALLNLADFAADEALATRAAMLVDLILLDMAVDSFYGHYATSHGRATANNVKSAAGDSVVTSQALLWGLGRFQSNSNMGSVSLALSEKYTVPPVLEEVALDLPEELINLERHSINPTREEAVSRELTFGPEDVDIWWGMGAFTHPLVIDTTLELADRWGLWHYPDFKDFAFIGKVLQKLKLLGWASRLLQPDPNGTLTSEVNKITYRTPDYALANAQDWRKGEKGYQQHIWQATLGPYAVVFATNPDSLREDDRHRPSYWISHGRLPRTAQYRNVLVALHDLPRGKGLLEARHFNFTHAYFPRWAFDEVREIEAPSGGGWICGREGDGYIALYCHLPYRWQEQGPDAGQEIIAVGRRNVWLVQMGRRKVEGSFDDFVAAVTGAPLEVRGLQVTYASPGNGELNFGWKGPLQVQGKEIPLRDYPRWENPYLQAGFDERRFVISHRGHRLELDFDDVVRIID